MYIMSVYAGPIKTRIDGARHRNDFEATAQELVNRVDDRLGVNDHGIVVELEQWEIEALQSHLLRRNVELPKIPRGKRLTSRSTSAESRERLRS